MDRVSPSSARALQRLGLAARGRSPTTQDLPVAAGPTVFKLSDPLDPVETLLDLWDEADPVRKRKARMLRRNRADSLGIDEEGQAVYNGRRCCLKTLLDLDKILYRLRLPHRVTCTCGAKYEIAMAPREERRHE